MAEYDTEDCVRLSDLFDEALDLYEQILKSNEASSSPKLQADIKKCVSLLEKSTNLINIGGVFSSNETISEVPTSNVKYLLIPAFLGNLVCKIQSPDRLSTLETAEIYFKDFLKRIHEYEIITREEIKSIEENEETKPRKMDLNDLARERNEKIRKYKEQKEFETELNRLKSLKDRDDETCRKYYLMYIKSFVNASLDELKSIKEEKPLAKHLADMRQGKTLVSAEAKEALNDRLITKPLKPIIITRNELQKQVFGAGYPSLPTLTVDEFYQQRVAEGIFPAEGSKYSKTLQDMTDPEIAKQEEEQEEIRKENERDTDDPEILARMRNMDEYKDDHKRGWGNRMNRS